MGLAWRVMHDLQTHIRGFSKPPFSLSLELATNAMLTFQNRWRLMLNNLHWAGAMLNPLLRGWAPLHEDENSRTVLNRVLRRLAPEEDTYVQILHQYQDFLETRGPFVDSTDPNVHAAPFHVKIIISQHDQKLHLRSATPQTDNQIMISAQTSLKRTQGVSKQMIPKYGFERNGLHKCGLLVLSRTLVIYYLCQN